MNLITNILFKMQFFFKGDQCLKSYKDQADSYICSVLPESPYFKIPMTPGLLALCIFPSIVMAIYENNAYYSKSLIDLQVE